MTRKHRKTVQWNKKQKYEKSEELNKKIEIIKKYHINSGCREYKKNAVFTATESTKIRIKQAEERIWEIETWNYPVRGNQRKRMKKSDESLHDLWDTKQRTNLWIIGVPGEERKEVRQLI